jgi:hypothetical protein
LRRFTGSLYLISRTPALYPETLPGLNTEVSHVTGEKPDDAIYL